MVVIGDQFCDDDGVVIGTHGFYVDVTSVEQLREKMVIARVDEITHHRGPIEHVKGMLMLIYDVNEEVAFGLLKWLSQEYNVKRSSERSLSRCPAPEKPLIKFWSGHMQEIAPAPY